MEKKSLELRIRTTKKFTDLPEHNKTLVIGYVLGCEDTIARFETQKKAHKQKKETQLT